MFECYTPLKCIVLNYVRLPYADSVKYLGVMFTRDLNNNIDMLGQVKTFNELCNTILPQFDKCDVLARLKHFWGFCTCYYCHICG